MPKVTFRCEVGDAEALRSARGLCSRASTLARDNHQEAAALALAAYEAVRHLSETNPTRRASLALARIMNPDSDIK